MAEFTDSPIRTEIKEKCTLNHPRDHGKIFEFDMLIVSGTQACVPVSIFARFESLVESTRGDLFKVESGGQYYDVPADLDLYQTRDGTEVSDITPDNAVQILVQLTRLPTKNWVIYYGKGEKWIQRTKKN
ncbi:hypothetical protein VKT23_017079 [Stygiomarasmius scandens]|uniref:Uncharacterized protein n=1 Tax=Marasmiellus scandens TaxID=2682957 RepID=A0ABR1IT89_9AGAR